MIFWSQKILIFKNRFSKSFKHWLSSIRYQCLHGWRVCSGGTWSSRASCAPWSVVIHTLLDQRWEAGHYSHSRNPSVPPFNQNQWFLYFFMIRYWNTRTARRRRTIFVFSASEIYFCFRNLSFSTHDSASKFIQFVLGNDSFVFQKSDKKNRVSKKSRISKKILDFQFRNLKIGL